MPEFGSFSGLSLDKKLSKEELIRAVRFLVSAEYEAIDMYSRISEATTDNIIKKAIEDVTIEERKHAGEFLKMLTMLDPEEIKFYQEGFKEVEEGMGKQAVSNQIRALAREVHEGKYVWQKTEKGDAKTLMFKSPFTGKKYHVSPCASDPNAPENKDIFKCVDRECGTTTQYKNLDKNNPKCPVCHKPMYNTEDEKTASLDPCAAILLAQIKKPVNVAQVIKAGEEIKKQGDKLSSEMLKKILTDHQFVLFSSSPDAVDKLLFNIKKIKVK